MIHVSKKKLLVSMLTVALFAFAVYFTSASGILQAKPALADNGSSAADTTHTITVQGEGSMTVAPDVAYVNVGVSSEAKTAQEAQSENAQSFSKLQNVLYTQYGLSKDDVQTSNFSVQPKYDYSNNTRKITGYTATQMLKITYRKLDNLGKFLDAVSNAGANRINGIQFSTEKNQQYELQVIKTAMNNARAKAEAIAQAENKSIDSMVSAVQGGSGPRPPVVYSNYSALKMDASSSSASTSVSPGQLTEKTTVTVKYSFN